MMQSASFAIAVLALLLSAFTFYWTALRNRRSFHFVRTSNLLSILPIKFALVNGGKQDLLITDARCHFQCKGKSRGAYPAQRLHLEEGNSMLLPSGKAIHCYVEFIERFSSEFVLSGDQDPQFGNHYCFPMTVEIEWVEMNGSAHKKSVAHSKIGFDESGDIRICSPMGSGYDLYANKP